MDAESVNSQFVPFARFATPRTGHELAECLRQLADHVDRDDILWLELSYRLETEEGRPVVGKDERLWRTYKHTGEERFFAHWKESR